MRQLNTYYSKALDLEIPYLITTPTGFDPARESLPLILFLHGAGERGSDVRSVSTGSRNISARMRITFRSV